jgi:hypothetical protein
MSHEHDLFRLARGRIDRSLLSLPSTFERAAGEPVDVVVFSRLIIALNTVASILQTEAMKCPHNCGSIMREAADVLWSVGEKAGEIAPALRMLDEARPRT